MKKAYLIRMSEDGNMPYVYTNVKALFNGIIETGYNVNYICIMDDNYKWINLKLTYSNLVKALKKEYITRLHVEINAGGYGSLEIQEVSIKTK